VPYFRSNYTVINIIVIAEIVMFKAKAHGWVKFVQIERSIAFLSNNLTFEPTVSCHDPHDRNIMLAVYNQLFLSLRCPLHPCRYLWMYFRFGYL
jgi:hypothetical protein